MADRYWVGGTASWDGTAGTKWATTSGGAGGASVPTTADDVFFTNLSTGTCTIAAGNTGAKSINCTGFTGTIAGTAGITVAGSVTLVAGMTYTNSGQFVIIGTGTIITAGKVFNALTINGVGITVTLGGALNIGSRVITVESGTFNTANYAVTAGSLNSSNSNTRTITLGSSTILLESVTGLDFSTSTNLTLNAGTSQINLNSLSATLRGGSLTYYNLSFINSNSGTRTIVGTNTFNNLSLTASATGITQLSLAANQTVNGTFTCAGSSAIRRGFVRSDTIGTTRTITAATLSANDCDFRDITIAGGAAGTSPTRAGDCGRNSGITFPAAKTVYRVGSTTSWNSTSSWALTSNGTGDTNNFPLAQDTAIIDNVATSSITIGLTFGYNFGTINASSRTNAITLNHSNASTIFYGSYIIGSGVTVAGTSNQTFSGSGTMVFTSAGKTITFPIIVDTPNGTFQLGGAVSSSTTIRHTRGTLNLNNYTLTCTTFSLIDNNVISIAFGTGNITVTGTTGAVWASNTLTNFSTSGTQIVNVTNNTANAISVTTQSLDENNAISFNFTAGTYLLTLNGNYRNVNFTGFNGSLNNSIRTFFGNVLFSSGMSFISGSSLQTFGATSGTQELTTNGKTLDFPITKLNGGTLQLNGSVTLGGTRTFLLTQGTLNLNNYTLTVPLFNSTGTNIRSIVFGNGNITVTSTGTCWTISSTQLSTSGNQIVNIVNNSGGTVTVNPSGLSEENTISFNFIGTHNVSMSNGTLRNLNFANFIGTFANSGSQNLYGDLTISTTTTFNATEQISFNSTLVTQNITSNGKLIGCNINKSGTANLKLQDNLTLNNNKTFNIFSGILDLNGYTLTCGIFSSNTANTRSIINNSNGIILTGSGDVWYISGVTTNFTANNTNIIISDTDTTAKRFLGGGANYGNLSLSGNNIYTLTIVGSNTFATVSNNKTSAVTVSLTAGTTQTVTNWNLSGTSGKLVTLNSTVAGTRATISQSAGTVSVSFCDIKDNNATGGATFEAFTVNGNVNSGNNLGWVFTGIILGTGNYFLMF